MQPTLPIHFAPLQGYTDAIYRNAHAACFGGVETYYTPFVRIEKGTFRKRDVRDLLPENNAVPRLLPQAIAPEPALLETILELFIEQGYTEVDINLGCPFPMLARRCNGAGILPFPEKVAALLSVVEKYPQLQFSVKMRLGWDSPQECLTLLPLLNELPLRQIAMHPRLGTQQYKGEVDLDAFAPFYEACRHPLLYNGDLTSIEAIDRIAERFPRLAGILVGRGLLANPALALEYAQAAPLAPTEKIERLAKMHRTVLEHYEQRLEGGEGQLLNKMHTFWEYLLPEAERKLMKAIHKSTNMNKYRQAVSNFLAHR